MTVPLKLWHRGMSGRCGQAESTGGIRNHSSAWSVSGLPDPGGFLLLTQWLFHMECSNAGMPHSISWPCTPFSRLLQRWVVLSQERLQLQLVTDQTHPPLGLSRGHPGDTHGPGAVSAASPEAPAAQPWGHPGFPQLGQGDPGAPRLSSHQGLADTFGLKPTYCDVHVAFL